ncbi:hypothetical protein LSTR_LSTR014203 [Laodelphax striatellus]|uniref:Uncharacterized protein n=1 Tax=Laodelphax striatellus TaxID=195883 RepID=A0A482WU77_LAOST|nr:hypothetical protein LSTR_LSTR013275 [Laodelphax striatellus]RZF39097.1 hypothetical protein LSTR_LSTR015812 [Laodelphax striatellus]RZF40222.1 hypothetical protein LSTR_LSTR014203 [Laodelphax striatellus]
MHSSRTLSIDRVNTLSCYHVELASGRAAVAGAADTLVGAAERELRARPTAASRGAGGEAASATCVASRLVYGRR